MKASTECPLLLSPMGRDCITCGITMECCEDFEDPYFLNCSIYLERAVDVALWLSDERKKSE